MAGPPIRCAPVDSVLVVEAPAGRVEFYQLVTHDDDFVTQQARCCWVLTGRGVKLTGVGNSVVWSCDV